MIPANGRRGREFIIVDEWGPYDFRSPKLWPCATSVQEPIEEGQVSQRRPVPRSPNALKTVTERLRVLGPVGTWKLARIVGGTLSATSGTVPGEVTVTRTPNAADLRVDLTYTGAEVLTPSGRRLPAGEPSTFSYARFTPPIAWTARFYIWPEAADPLAAPEAFRQGMAGAPALTEPTASLDYNSGRALREGLPRDRVALVAEGRVTLPPGPEGAYEIRAISDDGIRVWVDGRLVIDRWNIHESTIDRAPLAGGPHQVKVEYFESTGWAELRVDFARR
jgi:hypothetical protein